MEGTVTLTLAADGSLTLQSELSPLVVVFLLEKAKLSLLANSAVAPPALIVPAVVVPRFNGGGP